MHINFRKLKKLVTNQDGGVAVEFAIVSGLLITIGLGVLEFGRALQVRNELAYAADYGTRNVLMNSTVDQDAVEAAIRSHFNGYNKDDLTVVLGTETVDGIPFRTLVLTYPVHVFIPGFNKTMTLSVSRRAPEVS